MLLCNVSEEYKEKLVLCQFVFASIKLRPNCPVQVENAAAMLPFTSATELPGTHNSARKYRRYWISSWHNKLDEDWDVIASVIPNVGGVFSVSRIQ
jgi:hypothetical protein